jgi:hypothetical protein
MIGNDGLPAPVWGSQVAVSDSNLGLIPAWQFSQNPADNPLLTPYMTYPPGMNQSTGQPIGPYYGGGMNGLGIDNPFDSWWWQNRKWLAFGAVTALAVGVFGGLTALLK